MKLSKKNIISLFEDSKSKNFTIKNVVIFDKDIVIDISIGVDVHQDIYVDADTNINVDIGFDINIYGHNIIS